MEAWRGGRYVGLLDVLGALGTRVSPLLWALYLDEVAPHPLAARLEEVASEGRVPTSDLFKLLDQNLRVIDGEVRGYADSSSLRVVIRAVDGTSWDLEAASDE